MSVRPAGQHQAAPRNIVKMSDPERIQSNLGGQVFVESIERGTIYGLIQFLIENNLSNRHLNGDYGFVAQQIMVGDDFQEVTQRLIEAAAQDADLITLFTAELPNAPMPTSSVGLVIELRAVRLRRDGYSPLLIGLYSETDLSIPDQSLVHFVAMAEPPEAGILDDSQAREELEHFMLIDEWGDRWRPFG